MKLRLLLLLAAPVFVLSGCTEDDVVSDSFPEPNELDVALENALLSASNGQGLEFYRFPTSLNEIPQDPNNPLTAAKVELGKLLYHETGMAVHPKHPESQFTYSCASCHHAPGGFQACVPQGISDGGLGFGLYGEGRYPNPNYPIGDLDVQPLRTPSVLNIAYQTNILWNGQFGATHLNVGTEAGWAAGTPKVWNHLGFEGTEIQAIAGIDVHRLDMTESLFNSSEYKNLYYAAFGNIGDDTLISNVYTGLAIAAYERTVLAHEAPFQKWLNGDKNALSEKEKRGAVAFFTKGECYKCHNGPALNSMEFYALGMPNLESNIPGVYLTATDEVANRGRGGFTNNPADNYKFKVPQLYNLVQSKFYGHGATFRSVEEVIEYKNAAQPENQDVPESQLAEDFHPLNLTNKEIEDIAAFIEYGLYDRNLERYVPQSLPSGFCFPNNDYRSAQQMGCD
ncbi:MAG: cytochrome-c peroxidase [Flavobacteriales bacterium]|nr:cytochrome-c peroxidase [Flavobacteriales bacterium]MCB9191354.1 cytochrome-c peroxidase [Flavobacteriales bacterium]MCB9204020.1 cytochrome-c peroxidase [Flavobacteriales bacterium]